KAGMLGCASRKSASSDSCNPTGKAASVSSAAVMGCQIGQSDICSPASPAETFSSANNCASVAVCSNANSGTTVSNSLRIASSSGTGSSAAKLATLSRATTASGGISEGRPSAAIGSASVWAMTGTASVWATTGSASVWATTGSASVCATTGSAGASTGAGGTTLIAAFSWTGINGITCTGTGYSTIAPGAMRTLRSSEAAIWAAACNACSGEYSATVM